MLVTPCVGVWIETQTTATSVNVLFVTPCVGVWIETFMIQTHKCCTSVTPCVGVWIETGDKSGKDENFGSHTLRGCVD